MTAPNPSNGASTRRGFLGRLWMWLGGLAVLEGTWITASILRPRPKRVAGGLPWLPCFPPAATPRVQSSCDYPPAKREAPGSPRWRLQTNGHYPVPSLRPLKNAQTR